MTPWLLPVVSAAAMAVQDVLGVLMVQAEASYRAHRAGLLDMAADAARMTAAVVTTGTVLLSRDVALKAAVIAATLAADYAATAAGVMIGRRLDRHEGET